mgnify:FL=1
MLADIVENIVKAEPDFAALQGWIEAPSHISIGWTYDNGVWSEPVKPETTLEERMTAAAQECSRRIYAVADATAQMNMASRASADLMSADQMTAWKSSLAWVDQMRGTWRDLAADTTKDITDDANWPECPSDVVALADLF